MAIELSDAAVAPQHRFIVPRGSAIQQFARATRLTNAPGVRNGASSRDRHRRAEGGAP